jgi:hypothetical protein
MRWLALGACLCALQGCAAFLPALTAIGAIAGTIGTTEQLGITGIGDWMALKAKPVGTCNNGTSK